MGVNLGEITQVQKQVQQQALAQMQARREVAASLQQSQMGNQATRVE
jgi:hypothetical protein